MAVTKGPKILLLGGGFTLERLALTLAPEDFIITSRRDDKFSEWKGRGWNAAKVSLEDPAQISSVLTAYPTLETILDGVPPLHSVSPEAGVQGVCDAIVRVGIRRVMYLSTTGVFGIRDGSWVDEKTQSVPMSPPAKARLSCELLYRSTGLPLLVLRLPAIYGEGRGIVESLRRGTYTLIDDGQNWTNRIHVIDLVDILSHLLKQESAPECLCVSDDSPAKARDVAEFICSKVGIPFPGSITAEEAERRGAYTLLSNQRVKNTLLKATYPSPLKYPTYKEGLLQSMEYLQ